jgi:tRNA nucleotidyltransferase/poly(A) polymerase
LARFAAHYGLAIEKESWEGARGALQALGGLSPERVLAELQRMAEGADPARAFMLLAELGVLQLLPGFCDLEASQLAERVRALRGLEGRSLTRVLATLLAPPGEAVGAAPFDSLLKLRPSRELQQAVSRVFAVQGELGAVLMGLSKIPRSRWVRLVRLAEFEEALSVWRALHPGQCLEAGAELAQRRQQGETALFPSRLITSEDLRQAGIRPGPRWGELLRKAEDAQIDGEIQDKHSALSWLARALATEG